MRVLVVEDEEFFADAIATGLRRDGLAVDVALDGEAAMRRIEVNSYDVVVLDRDLPLRHGDEVCRSLVRDAPETRVLMLTAAASVDDRVEGLRIGADDYLVKPFAFRELLARVRSLARRGGVRAPEVLEFQELRLLPARREAFRAGRRLDLSRNEFAVLDVLMRADGDVVSAEELLERVWDERTDPFTNTVRMTIMRLRRKIGEPSYVATVPGCGYRLERT